MALKLEISIEELQQLTYKSHTINSGFTRVVIIDTDKSPREIIAKIKKLEKGDTFSYSLI
jgi:hypothetical protein